MLWTSLGILREGVDAALLPLVSYYAPAIVQLSFFLLVFSCERLRVDGTKVMALNRLAIA